MKKMILMLALAFATTAMYAQKNKPLEPLKSENKIYVTLDFTDAIMAGMPIDTFKEYVPAHYDDKTFDGYLYPYLLDRFISEFNDEMMDRKGKIIFATPNPKDVKYTLVVKVHMMNRDGDTHAEVSFVESGTTNVLVANEYRAKGGTFGTVPNLMGDGMENLAESLVKYICRNIR